jgi:hypothetical protein
VRAGQLRAQLAELEDVLTPMRIDSATETNSSLPRTPVAVA